MFYCLQLGTAFGLTITTTVFNSVVKEESAQLGVTLDSEMTGAPRSADLNGYKAAQWTAAGFCLLGRYFERILNSPTHISVSASLLGLAFLKSVGVVGQKEADDTEHSCPVRGKHLELKHLNGSIHGHRRQ